MLPGGVDPVLGAVHRSPTPFPGPPLVARPALAALAGILDQAGALPHDSVDLRIARDVRHGTGHQIDSPEQVGGWPQLTSAAPYPDEDADGMDDRWEQAHGLDPADASDRNIATNGEGCTNLDRFLSELAGDSD